MSVPVKPVAGAQPPPIDISVLLSARADGRRESGSGGHEGSGTGGHGGSGTGGSGTGGRGGSGTGGSWGGGSWGGGSWGGSSSGGGPGGGSSRNHSMLKRFSTRQMPHRTAGQGATEENATEENAPQWSAREVASENQPSVGRGRSRKSIRQENEQSKFHELLLFMDPENDIADDQNRIRRTSMGRMRFGRNVGIMKKINEKIAKRKLEPVFYKVRIDGKSAKTVRNTYATPPLTSSPPLLPPKYLWYSMIRRAQLVSTILTGTLIISLLLIFTVPPLVASVSEKTDEWKSSWVRRGITLLVVFVVTFPGTYIAFKYDIPSTPNPKIGVYYVSILFLVLAGSEINQNYIMFPILQCLTIISAPFLATTRNKFLVAQFVVSLGLCAYRIASGRCVRMDRFTGGGGWGAGNLKHPLAVWSSLRSFKLTPSLSSSQLP